MFHFNQVRFIKHESKESGMPIIVSSDTIHLLSTRKEHVEKLFAYSIINKEMQESKNDNVSEYISFM